MALPKEIEKQINDGHTKIMAELHKFEREVNDKLKRMHVSIESALKEKFSGEFTRIAEGLNTIEASLKKEK